MEKNELLVICFGFDTTTSIVKSFNLVFSNFKQSISFIDFSKIFLKFSSFISVIIVNGSTLSKSFLVIIFVGIGGALLFKKSKTPEAVEFTFSIKDCEDLFCGWIGLTKGNTGCWFMLRFICWFWLGLYKGIFDIWGIFGGKASFWLDCWIWLGFWDGDWVRGIGCAPVKKFDLDVSKFWFFSGFSIFNKWLFFELNNKSKMFKKRKLEKINLL